MALGLVQKGPTTVPGDLNRKSFIITCDNSYPNPAGYVLNAGTFGFQVLRRVIFNFFTTLAGASYEPVIIPTFSSDGTEVLTSAALHFVVSATGVEVANGVNLSTTAFEVFVEGY